VAGKHASEIAKNRNTVILKSSKKHFKLVNLAIKGPPTVNGKQHSKLATLHAPYHQKMAKLFISEEFTFSTIINPRVRDFLTSFIAQINIFNYSRQECIFGRLKTTRAFRDVKFRDMLVQHPPQTEITERLLLAFTFIQIRVKFVTVRAKESTNVILLGPLDDKIILIENPPSRYHVLGR
jgi:hypothetical protein